MAIRFDLNPPTEQTVAHKINVANGSTEVQFRLLSLPLYAVEQLARIIE